MSRSAKVRRFFGEADYDFALRIGECEELQDIVDVGLMVTLQRVAEVRVKEIKAVVRLGLIGAGMGKEEAFRLIERHVAPGYLADCSLIAVEIINAAIAGAPDEPPGEEKGEGISDPLSQTESSDTPISTEPGEPSASRPKRSRKARSGGSTQP